MGKTNKGQVDNDSNLKKYEKVTIILTIVGIGVSLVVSGFSLYISNSNSFNIANYTMQQQILFDKRGAAIQLSIEIKSLNNDSLQFYAHQYFKNLDLSKDGENCIINPNENTRLFITGNNAPILAPYILVLYNNTIIHADKLFATPQLLENGTVNYSVSYPNDKDTQRKIECKLTFPIVPNKLYNDHGIYYFYVKDISKFPPNLTYDLDLFYDKITSAETEREYIQNYLDTNSSYYYLKTNSNNPIKLQYFAAYMDMRTNIMQASLLAPTIIQELDDEISKN